MPSWRGWNRDRMLPRLASMALPLVGCVVFQALVACSLFGQAGTPTAIQRSTETSESAPSRATSDADLHSQVVLQSALTRIVETVDLSAAQSGVLSRLNAREGQIVARGDRLGIVEDSVLKLKLRRTQLEAGVAERQAASDVLVRLAYKAHELAETEYERALALNAKIPDSVSQREVNGLRLAMEKAELEIEDAQHQHEIAKLTHRQLQADVEIAAAELARAQLLAPMNGVVVHVAKRQGEWVDAGELVVRIVRVDRVRAEGFVTAAEAATGLQGSRAVLTMQVPGVSTDAFEGEVVFVSPDANPVDGRVRVWADFDNLQRLLRPGLPVDVRIAVETAVETVETVEQ